MKIWLARPKFYGQEINFLKESIDQNWIGTVGGKKELFRDELAQFLHFNKGINLFNSGTSALHTALILADVKTGDYVLCSTLTFVASANAICYQGGIPIFVDSELDTWNMCPETLELALKTLDSKNKLPKAVMLVHVFGIPAKIEAIRIICNTYGVKLIEDAAGAFGSKVNDQFVGTFGDYGIFSLNANKIITSGSGGILLSKSAENQKRIESLIGHSKENVNPYEHNEIGFNFGMNNLSVAVARAQLAFFDSIMSEKKQIYLTYKKQLTGLEFVKDRANVGLNHWLSCVLFHSEDTKIKVFKALEQSSIQSRYFWKPMHMQNLYKDCTSFLNGNSEQLFRLGLSMPSDINMNSEEQQFVIDKVKSITDLG